MNKKKVIVIGCGFAGLSAACFLAKAGFDVIVLEKHDQPGGRARQIQIEGFKFDMGPSWYWMPDIFERFFCRFNKKVSDYYDLKRLDPSYRIYWENDITDIPAEYESLKNIFEKTEAGSGAMLDRFLNEAAFKYKTGMDNMVYKPGLSILELLDKDMLAGILKLDVFTSMEKHIGNYFRHPRLQQILKFPILFLGALPQKIPALYSLMNFADIKGGTWFPEGGMYSIVSAIYKLALELGVQFLFEKEVIKIETGKNIAKYLIAQNRNGESGTFTADIIISNADYHFTENALLDSDARNYPEKYWDKKLLAPSCILFFIGLNKKLKNTCHHSLFFDTSFETHAKEIYETKKWPAEPLFYVCMPTATDKTLAPAGCENLFFLIPVPAGLEGDSDTLRENYFNKILNRFEKKTGENIRQNIIVKKSYGATNFAKDYNAYKGNAYGLANTLKQTAVFKPSIRNKKIKNLFYTGQLTVPGPGVPPALISGEVVANHIIKSYRVQ